MSEIKSYIDAIKLEKDKITPEVLKSGVKIFNIDGTLEEGIDTSDATVKPADLVSGTVAYGSSGKIVGTLNRERVATDASLSFESQPSDETSLNCMNAQGYAIRLNNAILELLKIEEYNMTKIMEIDISEYVTANYNMTRCSLSSFDGNTMLLVFNNLYTSGGVKIMQIEYKNGVWSSSLIHTYKPYTDYNYSVASFVEYANKLLLVALNTSAAGSSSSSAKYGRERMTIDNIIWDKTNKTVSTSNLYTSNEVMVVYNINDFDFSYSILSNGNLSIAYQAFDPYQGNYDDGLIFILTPGLSLVDSKSVGDYGGAGVFGNYAILKNKNIWTLYDLSESTFKQITTITVGASNYTSYYFTGIGDAFILSSENGSSDVSYKYLNGTLTKITLPFTSVKSTGIWGTTTKAVIKGTDGKYWFIKWDVDNYVTTKFTENSVNFLNTDDGTATADEIKMGRTAYVKGSKVVGTLEYTMSSADPITAGSQPVVNYDGTSLTVDRTYGKALLMKRDQQIRSNVSNSTIATLGDITPDKIKKGEIIYGVEGTLEGGIDTSDATATPEDIAEGLTAYANGEKITGELTDYRDGTPFVKHDPYVFVDTDEPEITAFMTSGYSGIIGSTTTIRLSMYNNTLADRFEITPDKLKRGYSLFGVDGELDGAEDLEAQLDAQDQIIIELQEALHNKSGSGEISSLDFIPTDVNLVNDSTYETTLQFPIDFNYFNTGFGAISEKYDDETGEYIKNVNEIGVDCIWYDTDVQDVSLSINCWDADESATYRVRIMTNRKDKIYCNIINLHFQSEDGE